MATLLEWSFTSCACAHLPASVLALIERETWRNNVRRGLSGEIHFEDGRFRQIVEGPSCEILPLAASVLADPRHYAIEVLALEPIERRSFSGWRSFGFQFRKHDPFANNPNVEPFLRDMIGVRAPQGRHPARFLASGI
jgi:hypothetical protein